MEYQAVCQICHETSPRETSKESVHPWANRHIDEKHATELYPSIVIEEYE